MKPFSSPTTHCLRAERCRFITDLLLICCCLHQFTNSLRPRSLDAVYPYLLTFHYIIMSANKQTSWLLLTPLFPTVLWSIDHTLIVLRKSINFWNLLTSKNSMLSCSLYHCCTIYWNDRTKGKPAVKEKVFITTRASD